MVPRLKSQPSQHPTTRIEPRPFCACGLSRTFPFCDSSQMIAKTNVPGVLVRCGAAKAAERPRAEAQSLVT